MPVGSSEARPEERIWGAGRGKPWGRSVSFDVYAKYRPQGFSGLRLAHHLQPAIRFLYQRVSLFYFLGLGDSTGQETMNNQQVF
jgi:hypothetical protein